MIYRALKQLPALILLTLVANACQSGTTVQRNINACPQSTLSETDDPKSHFVFTVEVTKGQLNVPIEVAKIAHSTFANHFSVDCRANERWKHVNDTDEIVCRYAKPGRYTIRIRGHVDSLRFICGSGRNAHFDVLSIDQWGTNVWHSMERLTVNCRKMHILATDQPDLSRCESSVAMFFNAAAMNEDISHWDVSNIRLMTLMFAGATSFNQPLEAWDVSNVVKMNGMFADAVSFNQPLGQWQVDHVVNMHTMFMGAQSFDQSLAQWHLNDEVNTMLMFKSCPIQPSHQPVIPVQSLSDKPLK